MRKHDWLCFVWFSLVILMAMQSARAGTYNFYFNNTEQGDNSSATPSVVVKDGMGASASPVASPSPVISPEPSPVPSPTVNSSESVATMDDSTFSKRLRLIGGIEAFSETYSSTHRVPNPDRDSFWNPTYRDETVTGHRTAITYHLAAHYFPIDVLGVGAFLGYLSGIEASLVTFGISQPLQFELTMGRGEHLFSLFHNKGEWLGGLRVSLEIQRSFGITVGWRTYLQGDLASSGIFDAGMTFRL